LVGIYVVGEKSENPTSHSEMSSQVLQMGIAAELELSSCLSLFWRWWLILLLLLSKNPQDLLHRVGLLLLSLLSLARILWAAKQVLQGSCH